MSLWNSLVLAAAQTALNFAKVILPEDESLKGQPAKRGFPPWIDIAEAELDQKETPGSKHNPKILEYHSTTTLRASQDEVPWCSSFVNWVMIHAGVKGTNSAAARSWQKWGLGLSEPKIGAIAVLSRGKNPAKGHVGFVAAFDLEKKNVLLLAGNQGNRVSIQNFPMSRVVAYRWPEVI